MAAHQLSSHIMSLKMIPAGQVDAGVWFVRDRSDLWYPPCPQASSDEHGKSTGEQSDDEEEDARHQAMVEAVSGGTSKRKRKRTDVVVTEAYPESEYNLNPMAASAGVSNHWSSKAIVTSWWPHPQACFAECLLAVPDYFPSFALVDKLDFKYLLHPVRCWQLSPILLC